MPDRQMTAGLQYRSNTVANPTSPPARLSFQDRPPSAYDLDQQLAAQHDWSLAPEENHEMVASTSSPPPDMPLMCEPPRPTNGLDELCPAHHDDHALFDVTHTHLQ